MNNRGRNSMDRFLNQGNTILPHSDRMLWCPGTEAVESVSSGWGEGIEKIIGFFKTK